MIDAKLQASLRARFNPDGSDLRRIQLRMLDMLKYIDKICQENGIKYWLSSGSCLGAVRHRGFIPWDDDVDIELQRQDYRKLINVLSKENHPQFILQTDKNDPNYLHPYAKLRDLHSIVKENNNNDINNKYNGCFIDIFCIEPSYSKKLWKICGGFWNKLILPQALIKNPLIRRFLIGILRFSFLNIIFPIIRTGNLFYKTKKLRHCLGCGFIKERYKDDIKEVQYVLFEEYTLPVPQNYDHYLRCLYGIDYNNLPDLDNITNHIVKCYFIDN
ncbi:MAG: LicD family protein [Muribaculaceae bacterium]|nr:LicD family protein [Muribaculaceae bacterium]